MSPPTPASEPSPLAAPQPQIPPAALAMLLGALALALRAGVSLDGPPDIDTINFGLSAWRFDLADHQPHPPGYLGYVAWLRLLRALLPAMGPVDLALWGSRIAGALCAPAAWWAVSSVVRADGGEAGRAAKLGLAGAALAVTHPLLWYYGSDGQSHAAEALVTFTLVGAAARVHARPSAARLAALSFAVALSASLRPTIALAGLPLVGWLAWRRPRREGLLAAVAFAAGWVAWQAPLVWLSGGPSLYQRVNRALVTDIFIANYSALNLFTRPRNFALNVAVAAVSLAIAALSLPCWTLRPWALRRPVALGVALAALFYACVYTAESGYFSGVAALLCLAPVSWAEGDDRRLGLRLLAVCAACAALFLAGPSRLSVVLLLKLPTLAHLVENDLLHQRYRAHVCGPLEGAGALVVTDSPNTTVTRALPLRCPDVAVGWYMYRPVVNRRLDHWQVFYRDGMDTLPTPVPFEMGPPAEGRVRFPVRWVVVGPDASGPFRDAVRAMARCAPIAVPGSDATFYPAPCVSALRFGRNVLRVRAR